MIGEFRTGNDKLRFTFVSLHLEDGRIILAPIVAFRSYPCKQTVAFKAKQPTPSFLASSAKVEFAAVSATEVIVTEVHVVMIRKAGSHQYGIEVRLGIETQWSFHCAAVVLEDETAPQGGYLRDAVRRHEIAGCTVLLDTLLRVVVVEVLEETADEDCLLFRHQLSTGKDADQIDLAQQGLRLGYTQSGFELKEIVRCKGFGSELIAVVESYVERKSRGSGSRMKSIGEEAKAYIEDAIDRYPVEDASARSVRASHLSGRKSVEETHRIDYSCGNLSPCAFPPRSPIVNEKIRHSMPDLTKSNTPPNVVA